KADSDPDVYGFALKILGVQGERAIATYTSHNQDFLMVNNPTIPFGDAQAYATFLKLVGTVTSDVSTAKEKLQEIVGLIKNKQTPLVHKVISALSHAHTDHILGETFFSMAAMRYGNYMAKISVAPLSPEVSALTGTKVPNLDEFSSVRDAVVGFFKSNSAQYQLRAQLCANLDTMPIEDASILWSEDESAHQPIARIIIPQQEAYSPARRVFGDDILSYSPWNALAAHQPLGSLMRMRQKVYESSSVLRHDLNRQPRIEPTSITELPN
ncbi:MAG TPA: catalase family protein, partial [Thiolinea sp.]|nr:catalase family protein [Thiolinea sp.]